jgi:hypothetical protein
MLGEHSRGSGHEELSSFYSIDIALNGTIIFSLNRVKRFNMSISANSEMSIPTKMLPHEGVGFRSYLNDSFSIGDEKRVLT